MIKVSLFNIGNLGLPLYNKSKIIKRNSKSKNELKKLERKYKLKSNEVCIRTSSEGKYGYMIFENVIYRNIPIEDKFKWIENYEIYVRSHWKYKLDVIYHMYFKDKN